MATKKICPECTEIVQEQCDPICKEVNDAKCIIYSGAMTCLGIEEGDNVPLSEILPLICSLDGANLGVETAPATECVSAGTTVTIGLDTSGGGGVDVPLVSFDVCDGVDGVDGVTPTIVVTAIPAMIGSACATGGWNIEINGIDYVVCNGLNGKNGIDGEDTTSIFEGVDFSCLQALGVTVGDELTPQENMQGIIEALCLALQTSAPDPCPITIIDHEFDIVEDSGSQQINLLASSIINAGETVTAITIYGATTGDVDYDGSYPNVGLDGILDITGLAVGGDTLTYTVTTDGCGESDPKALIINVLAPPIAVTCFFDPDSADQLCFTRNQGNTEFGLELPINPMLDNVTGTIRIVTGEGNCGGVPPYVPTEDCPSKGNDRDVLITVSSLAAISVSSPSPSYATFSGSLNNGTLTINEDITPINCITTPECCCSTGFPYPAKAWFGDTVIITINLTGYLLGTPVSYETSVRYIDTGYVPLVGEAIPTTSKEQCYINPCST